MNILIVGSGESGAYWTDPSSDPYDIVAACNGAVLNGGHFDHFIAMDKFTPNLSALGGERAGVACQDDYFKVGVEGACALMLNPRNVPPAEALLEGRNGDEHPTIWKYHGCDHQRTIREVPGTYEHEFDGVVTPKIACNGTGLIAALHFYAWWPGVRKITLLGCEHSLTSCGRLHFYDDEPLDDYWHKEWDGRLERQVRHTADAVRITSELVPVDIHPEMGGRLRDAVTGVCVS